MVKDFVDGTSFKGLLLVVNSSRGVTNAGDAYMNVTLQDNSGSIEGKKWKINDEDIKIFEVGKVVMVEGEVYTYKTDLQMKILSASNVPLEVGDLNNFLESAPEERNKLLEEFASYLNEIDSKSIKAVLNEVFKDCLTSFSIYPAASRNHHEYVSGLIYHTVSMLRIAKALVLIYPNLDKNYLYAGIMLHDVGKIEELSGPSIPKYTIKGKLIGHISIASNWVSEACEKLNIDEEISTILNHIILSHHGQKEFGSPIEPLTREAQLITLIDNIDSKMNMIDKALKEVPEGEFTSRIMALDGRTFYHAKDTKNK